MKLDQIVGPGVNEWLVDQLRSWKIETLTEVQRLAVANGVADGRSMIVCAPTSSGKTMVGELAVLCGLKNGRKALYLVSHRALADQKYEDFQKRFGEGAASPLGSVGLSTGDREEGDYDAQLIVATYEKALGLVLAGELNSKNAVVIADELQIIGDPNRGPNIEALCALLRQRGVSQLVGLTATVENPKVLAEWLRCELTTSGRRDVPLHQEIWFEGKGYSVTSGEDEGRELATKARLPSGLMEVVQNLVASERAPILVFTESRRQAIQLAGEYSEKRTRAADGISIAQQLELFSEPTESSDQLRTIAEKRVAFHTADLSPQERQVIEQGFVDSRFDVCFATSTLAAGVNFPFKTVLFPKLSYQYGEREGTMMSRSDYRNMSGRAGRLGMHTDGYAILLPQNNVELRRANQLVLPENDAVVSQLVKLSMRRSVLMLIASGLVNSRVMIESFFENTLYWHQARENSAKLKQVISAASEAVDWLIGAKLAEEHHDTLLPTPIGKATSLSGLLPSTAAAFIELANEYQREFEEKFDTLIDGLLHWVCSCDEFQGQTPSRFLPWTTGRSPGSTAFVADRHLLQPIDRTNARLNQCVHALILYIDGLAERKIANFAAVSAGNVHRLAVDVSWVLDGLQRLSCVPDVSLSQHVANRLAMLARRVRWGSPVEALDVLRVAERYGVPGFGRQRAMALIQNGLATFDDILSIGKKKLLGILRNEQRTTALLDALESAVGNRPDRFTKTHLRVAKQLGLERLVEDCNSAIGADYEVAVRKLLEVESSWAVIELDDGKRQNVPDLLLQLGDVAVLIECKTCNKKPALISKEEAFAVMQKAADFETKMRRVTLGKPAFDEHSKVKAQASTEITLIEHSTFLEAILRVHAGLVTADEFLKWLTSPGVTEIARLTGKPTYATE